MNKKNVVYGLVAMSAIPFCFQLTCEIIQAEETNLPEVKDVKTAKKILKPKQKVVKSTNVGKRVANILKKVKRS